MIKLSRCLGTQVFPQGKKMRPKTEVVSRPSVLSQETVEVKRPPSDPRKPLKKGNNPLRPNLAVQPLVAC